MAASVPRIKATAVKSDNDPVHKRSQPLTHVTRKPVQLIFHTVLSPSMWKTKKNKERRKKKGCER